MNLDQLAGPMTVPFSTRRNAQAAALVLSLMGCRSLLYSSAEAEGTHVSIELAGLILWTTRCDPPLLRDEARGVAAETGKDVVIVRVGTGSAATPPVLFDWLPVAGAGLFGLIPAFPSGGGLALVKANDGNCRLEINGAGVTDRCRGTGRWRLERTSAVVKADVFFRSSLWGGL
jgi:hypothetical protein